MPLLVILMGCLAIPVTAGTYTVVGIWQAHPCVAGHFHVISLFCSEFDLLQPTLPVQVADVHSGCAVLTMSVSCSWCCKVCD